MKILLTGANGYLGRHVLTRLRERECEVVLLGRGRPPGTEGMRWLKVDLLKERDLTRALRDVQATHLLHLAWYAEHGKYWQSPLNLDWVDASLRLLQAFAGQGGRHVLMTGSCAEYDWSSLEGGELRAQLREDISPLRPASLYGVAKDATRRLAAAWCERYGVTLAWAHLFYAFGPGEAPQRMLPMLIEVFRGRAPPFGVNAAAYRGMLPVHDAAEALVHLLLRGCDGRYNICSGEPVEIAQVVRELARLCHADPQPVLNLASARPGDPPLLVGCNEKLRATGWRPTLTLAQGLALQAEQQP